MPQPGDKVLDWDPVDGLGTFGILGHRTLKSICLPPVEQLTIYQVFPSFNDRIYHL